MKIEETSRKISHLYQIFINEYSNFDKEFLVNVSDYNVFLSIQENPGCSQQFLAEKRRVQRSLLTRVITKYVNLGLIERRNSISNKSAYALYLTQTGEEITQEIRKKIIDLNKKIADSCSLEQYEQLNAALDSIINNWHK